MKNTNEVIDKLRFGGKSGQMTVLTPAEAQAVYDHIEQLEVRAETKQMKFMAICDQTYQMVKMNRELRRQLDEMSNDPQA